MVDIIGLIMQTINLKAALVGVGVVQLYKFWTPNPEDDYQAQRSMEMTEGSVWSRLIPFIGPISALLTTIALEWKTFGANVIVSGLLSGLASDFLLRIYYKTIKGI